MRLQDTAAIIPGGGQGTGLAPALKCARAGANVHLCDVRDDATERAVAPCRAAGASSFGHRVDVTQRDGVDATMAAVTQRNGRIDVLVNNAGITQDVPLRKMSLQRPMQ